MDRDGFIRQGHAAGLEVNQHWNGLADSFQFPGCCPLLQLRLHQFLDQDSLDAPNTYSPVFDRGTRQQALERLGETYHEILSVLEGIFQDRLIVTVEIEAGLRCHRLSRRDIRRTGEGHPTQQDGVQ